MSTLSLCFITGLPSSTISVYSFPPHLLCDKTGTIQTSTLTLHLTETVLTRHNRGETGACGGNDQIDRRSIFRITRKWMKIALKCSDIFFQSFFLSFCLKGYMWKPSAPQKMYSTDVFECRPSAYYYKLLLILQLKAYWKNKISIIKKYSLFINTVISAITHEISCNIT